MTEKKSLKLRLIGILRGEEDPDWEYVEEDLIYQNWTDGPPSKVAIYAGFDFVNKTTGKEIRLEPRDFVVLIPAAQFKISREE